jgi:hypothetical protein
MGVTNPRIFPDVGYKKWSKSSTFEVWYTFGSYNVSSTGVSSSGTNTLQAIPFFSGEGGKVDRIAFEVTTGGAAGSVARCGIYESTSDTNLYPSKLLADSGEFDTTTTGVKSATIDVQLLANRVYWLVLHPGVAAHVGRNVGAATIGGTPLGMPETMGNNAGRTSITVNRSYAALPATFPGSAATATGCNIVWFRYAS